MKSLWDFRGRNLDDHTYPLAMHSFVCLRQSQCWETCSAEWLTKKRMCNNERASIKQLVRIQNDAKLSRSQTSFEP